MAEFADGVLAKQVLNADAKRVGVSSLPLADLTEVTLVWKGSHNDPAQLVALLDKYGVGDNALAEPPVLSHVITDAIVENEPMPGKWRVVRNFFSLESKNDIYQTRRKGWITALVSGEAEAHVIDWSEARVLSGRDHRLFGGQTDDFVIVQWRGVDPDSAAGLAKSLMAAVPVDPDGWVPFADKATYGVNWSVLPVTFDEGEDGSYVLTMPLVKFGVTVVSHHNILGDVSQAVTVETVPEDQLQARIDVLKAAGHSDVVGDRSGDSGVAQIQYTTLTSHGGVVVYSYTTETGQTEYHKLAWEQTIADWAVLDYVPNGVSFSHLVRRVGAIRRNPLTKKWSYHIVVRDAGTQISSNPAAPNTSYRVKEYERSMWDTANNLYFDQIKLICYRHEMCTFSTFGAASAWTGGTLSAQPDEFVDGAPWYAPANPNNVLPPMEGAPIPRKIGVNKWLASRRLIEWESGHFDPTS